MVKHKIIEREQRNFNVKCPRCLEEISGVNITGTSTNKYSGFGRLVECNPYESKPLDFHAFGSIYSDETTIEMQIVCPKCKHTLLTKKGYINLVDDVRDFLKTLKRIEIGPKDSID